jgi:hypothetical protein
MREESLLPCYEIPYDDPIWFMDVGESLYDYSYRFAKAEGHDHWDAMHIALECVTVG